MVRGAEFPPVTSFSSAFARALADDMKAHKVTHQAVADVLGRSRAFVSDQVSGNRPVDTDVMSAVAEVAGVRTPALVRRVLGAMVPELRDQSALSAWLGDEEPAEDQALKPAARKPGRKPSLSEPEDTDQ
jgi:transcriptional regulator with XRE-family HTH domain